MGHRHHAAVLEAAAITAAVAQGDGVERGRGAINNIELAPVQGTVGIKPAAAQRQRAKLGLSTAPPRPTLPGRGSSGRRRYLSVAAQPSLKIAPPVWAMLFSKWLSLNGQRAVVAIHCPALDVGMVDKKMDAAPK